MPPPIAAPVEEAMGAMPVWLGDMAISVMAAVAVLMTIPE